MIPCPDCKTPLSYHPDAPVKPRRFHFVDTSPFFALGSLCLAMSLQGRWTEFVVALSLFALLALATLFGQSKCRDAYDKSMEAWIRVLVCGRCQKAFEIWPPPYRTGHSPILKNKFGVF